MGKQMAISVFTVIYFALLNRILLNHIKELSCNVYCQFNNLFNFLFLSFLIVLDAIWPNIVSIRCTVQLIFS